MNDEDCSVWKPIVVAVVWANSGEGEPKYGRNERGSQNTDNTKQKVGKRIGEEKHCEMKCRKGETWKAETADRRLWELNFVAEVRGLILEKTGPK